MFQIFPHKNFPVLLRGHSEFFLKGSEKTGIILKTAHHTSFSDCRMSEYRIPAEKKPFLRNKLMYRQAQIFFEYMGYVIFAYIKFFMRRFRMLQFVNRMEEKIRTEFFAKMEETINQYGRNVYHI